MPEPQSGDVLLWAVVPGAPKTKGSLEPRTRPCECCRACKGVIFTGMRESVKGSKLWRQLMARRFGELRKFAEPYSGEVTVVIVAYLPVANVIATRSGDVDKLERNVLDALTDAAIYVDDVQVVKATVEKVSTVGSVYDPGAAVMVLAGRV